MKIKDTSLEEKLKESYDENRAEFNTIALQAITAMEAVEAGKLSAMNDIAQYPLRVFSNRMHPKIVWDVLVMLHKAEERVTFLEGLDSTQPKE